MSILCSPSFHRPTERSVSACEGSEEERSEKTMHGCERIAKAESDEPEVSGSTIEEISTIIFVASRI